MREEAEEPRREPRATGVDAPDGLPGGYGLDPAGEFGHLPFIATI